MRLTQKERIQLEIIDVDHDLQQLARRDPATRSMVDRIRDALANIVFLVDDVDVREFTGLRCERGLE
jgi:hypothetical protein